MVSRNSEIILTIFWIFQIGRSIATAGKPNLLPSLISDASQKLRHPSPKSITDPPANIAAVIGSTVRFACDVTLAPPTSRINWYEYVTSEFGSVVSDNYQILPSHPNSARYRIVQETGSTSFYLEISDIRLEDGGTYLCSERIHEPAEQNNRIAELVVLGSTPVCSNSLPPDGVILEGRNYTITCSVNYTGAIPPTMTWTGPGNFQSFFSTTSTLVFSGIQFTAERIMDFQWFNCFTNFTEIGNIHVDGADNLPELEFIYQSQQLFVYWSPTNLRAVPAKNVYEVGEVVMCLADASPEPNYQWQNLQTLEVHFSQVFTISGLMAGLNSTMRCQVKNVIQGFVYTSNLFIAVNVAELPSTSPDSTVTSTTFGSTTSRPNTEEISTAFESTDKTIDDFNATSTEISHTEPGATDETVTIDESTVSSQTVAEVTGTEASVISESVSSNSLFTFEDATIHTEDFTEGIVDGSTTYDEGNSVGKDYSTAAVTEDSLTETTKGASDIIDNTSSTSIDADNTKEYLTSTQNSTTNAGYRNTDTAI